MLRIARVPLALAACAAAVLAGCTGSSGGGVPSAATLRSVVVRQGDLPAGYTAKAHGSTTTDQDTYQALQDCIGSKTIKKSDVVRRVTSDNFTSGKLSISSEASAYQSSGAVDDRVALLKSQYADRCLGGDFDQQVSTSLASGAGLDNLTFHVTPGSDGGPKAIVATAAGSIDVTQSGKKTTYRLGIAFLATDQLTATVFYLSQGPQIPTSLRHAVDRAVAARIAKA